jgi:hypothetical protein
VSDLGLLTSILLSADSLCVNCIGEKISRAPEQVVRLLAHIETLIVVAESQGVCPSCQKRAVLYAVSR